MSATISPRQAGALLALAALLLPPCASAPPGGAAMGAPRLHHLLDLEDARAPLTELEPMTRDADPEVRARAALAVARKGGVRAAALLELAARDPEARVREAVALALGLTGEGDLAGEALRMTRRADGSPAERALAAGSAVGLAGDRAWKEPEFAALFLHGEPAVRRAALRAAVMAARAWKEKPESLPRWVTAAFADGATPPDGRAAALLVARTLLAPQKAPRTLRTEAAEDALPFLTRVQSAVREDRDPDVRSAAALLLGALAHGGTGGLDDLLPTEPLGRVRVNIVRALGTVEDPAVATPLLRALAGDPDFGTRAAAAEALGAKERTSLPGVEEALAKAAIDDPSGLVRVTATGALGNPRTVIGKAALRLQAQSRFSMHRAAAAAGVLKQGGLEALSPLLRDPSVRVREAAVDAAGSLGREGLGACLDALDDEDPVVAAIAAGYLGAMGATEARDVLRAALRRAMEDVRFPDDGADLRASALEALGRVAKEEALPFARTLLGDPDPTVRFMAASVIAGPDGPKPEMPLPPRLREFPRREDLRVTDAGAARIRFTTERGEFVVRTLPSAAPVAVARLLERVREGGYDGTVFHRIVPAFVAQGGDPRGDGSGSGGATVRAEFSGVYYERGTLGVPRSSEAESGGCQLFFCHGSTPHLDRGYTVTGIVVEGIEVVDALDLGDILLTAKRCQTPVGRSPDR